MIQNKFLLKNGRFPKKVESLLNEEEEEMLIEVTKVNNLQRKYERFKKRYASTK